MARYAATEQAIQEAPHVFGLRMKSFRRHLHAENEAPRSVQTYTETLNRLAAYLSTQGMPIDPTLVSRKHIERFMADLLTQAPSCPPRRRTRLMSSRVGC
jgi:site-specific recombinase XerD